MIAWLRRRWDPAPGPQPYVMNCETHDEYGGRYVLPDGGGIAEWRCHVPKAAPLPPDVASRMIAAFSSSLLRRCSQRKAA